MMQTPPQHRQRQQGYVGSTSNNNNNKYGPSYGTSPAPYYVDQGLYVNGSTSSTGDRNNSPQRRRSSFGRNSSFAATMPSASRFFSEIPMTGRRRRRGDSLAKWTTRAVLASPLLVLFVWSLALVLHAGKTTTSLQNNNNAASSIRTMQQQQPRQTSSSRKISKKRKVPIRTLKAKAAASSNIVVQPHVESTRTKTNMEIPVVHQANVVPIVAPLGRTSKNIPAVDPLGNNSQENSNQQGYIPVVVNQNLGKSPVVPIVAPLGEQSVPSTGSANANQNVQVQEMGTSQQVQQLGTTSLQVQQLGTTSQQGVIQLTAAQGGNETAAVADNAMGSSQQDENSFGAVQSGNEMAAAVSQNAMASSQQDGNSLGTVESGNQLTTAEAAQETALQAAQNQAVPVQGANPLTSTQSSPKVYYYDASASTKNGQLYVPDVVYDEQGTPVKLTALNDGSTEIFLEPPQMGNSQNQRSTLGSTSQDSPKMELGEQILEGKAQDQMIIISTVATMALLVGALSARRMRSRHFLSACIENESLEDELAYDAAYTTYDTFGASPNWKGDLEKFDV